MEGREVSSSFFTVLGVTPHSGRVFLDDEDRAGAPPVAMIGHGLWQRQFGGDASALGQSIVFDGRPTPSSASPLQSSDGRDRRM